LAVLFHAPQKDKRHFLKIAALTAKENLKQHLNSKFTKRTQLQQLQRTLDLKTLPNTMECLDIKSINIFIMYSLEGVRVMVFNTTFNNILNKVQKCKYSLSDCYEHVFSGYFSL
jgi:excinuclease UvrABC nuclease subunit